MPDPNAPSSRTRTRRGWAALIALTVTVTGCAGSDDWSAPHDPPGPTAELPPSFIAPDASPSPASTISPRPGSWREVRPAEDGYRVALLEAGFDPASAPLAEGVRDWAEQNAASVKTVRVDAPEDEVAAIVDAIELDADLIVAASPAMVDALALVTASHLDEQFLLVGGQLPEPTANVTAVVWTGASTRGTEVENPADAHLEESYTAGNAARAVAAGVAGILNGLTGVVIEVP